ncbi:hypothetical protein T08_8621 [Trichinella sp. T8]|nr:hypothetical protein T08_8621 [Trichinella sp. T8]
MTKHPFILPDKHPLTRAIIRRCHLRQLHSGIETTLTMLRQRFWILRGRRNVKGMIKKCPCCRRVGSKPFVLKMAPLLADRIQPTRPFENTDLNLAGPLLTRNGKTVKKSYILIFTCMTTRAVHLEVVSDMTVDRVMEAIRRFIARHGKPRILQSDNFHSFKQLDQELQLLLDKKMTDCLEKELSAHRIQWKFITERAPWIGGYWERLIRFIKNSLHKVLQKTLVDEVGLNTILCDIEARINARPLTYLSKDPKDTEVLTPYHFLTGTNFMDLPEVNPEDEEWVRKLQLLQSYENNEAPQVGDIVLIEECNVPRNKWNLGKITEIYPGKYGIARTAKLRTSIGFIKRPTAKLHLIEPAVPN